MARTAPVPNIPAIPGMNPGVFVLGGGAGGGGSGGPGGGAGSGNQGGGGSNGGDGADGGEKGALDPEKYPLCGTKSHPVDVATGRAFTHPIPILELPGPMPLRIARSYSSTARHEDMGLGWGWAHSLGWRLVVGGRTIDVWTDLGTRARFPKALASGDEVAARFGYRLRREPSGFVVDPSDGRRYVFRDRLGERTWLLSAIEDANGNRVTLRYESGRLVEVIDSAGRVIRVRTDASGRVAAFEAKSAIAQGRWIAFERYDYDASGCLVRAVDADGFASTYEYDDEHRLTADTDRAGLCFHFRYDRESRCVESWGDYPGRVDPSLDDDVPVHLGGTLASEVEGTGPRAKGIHHCLFDYAAPDYTEVLDSTHRGRFAHNRFGLLTESADAGPAPVRASYTADGFLSILEYPDGGFERFERDPRGRVLTLADATGAVTVVRRDAEGRPIEVEDPLGRLTRFERDARGNAVLVVDPLGQVTAYRYDERGLVLERTDPNGAKTAFVYDAHGNSSQATLPNGTSWTFRHDALGRLLERVDPTGAPTRYAYSDRGDLVQTVDALGGVTRYAYDGERHLVRVEDPSGHVTELGWGGYHRLCWRKDANGHVVRLAYNREGELTRVINEVGEEHRLVRDLYGRLVEERTFDGRIIRYRLDLMGRASRVSTGSTTEAGGVEKHVDLTYDLAGRLVERAYSEGSESFGYDAAGNLVEVAWPGGRIELARDPLGRIVREAQKAAGHEHVIETSYDALGQRVGRRTSLGHTEAVTRDVLGGRVRTLLDGDLELTHALDAFSREVSRGLPGGGVVTSVYDPLGRLSQRRVAGPGRDVSVGAGEPDWVGRSRDAATAMLTYRYDPASELVASIDRARGTTEYRYDPVGQLVAAVPEKARREVFHYDPAGNLHEGDGAPARVYGQGNRLLRKGDTEYRWDDHGRLVEKREREEVWKYAWNEAGLLAAVDTPSGERVELEYDPFARRVQKRVTAWDAATAKRALVRDVRFVWDGDVLVHELVREVKERAASAGDPVVAVRTYCFEDDSFVPAAHREADGRWVHYINDPAGAPEKLVDGRAEVLCELERGAWELRQPAGARASTPVDAHSIPGAVRGRGDGATLQSRSVFRPCHRALHILGPDRTCGRRKRISICPQSSHVGRSARDDRLFSRRKRSDAANDARWEKRVSIAGPDAA